MLKFLFWILLLANVGLFAYERGYLAAWLPDGREPQRMEHQLNADNVKLIPAGEAEAKPAADAATGSADVRPAEAACSEIAGFDQAGAKRFDGAVQTLALGDKLSRREVEEAAHNIVYIPSQGSKEGADKKAAELRHLGISDFYVIQDAGDLHWGISLGVFKTEESARALLATLSQKGVHSARLGTHSVTSTKVVYQVRGLDAAAKTGLDKILLDFPHAEKHACGGEPSPDAKPALTEKKAMPRDAVH
jgi:hypothetical protein